MTITNARLTLGGSTYEILRFGYTFQRYIDSKGRPCGVYFGGEIEVQVESTDDEDLFWYMVDKDMPEANGAIEVLSGPDGSCVRRIAFKEAYVYAYSEEVHCRTGQPMVTTIRITPMLMSFNDVLSLGRRWPQERGSWERLKKEEAPRTTHGKTEENTTRPECTVSFRRCKGYDGSFGFDWVRTGDTGEPGCGWYRDTMADANAYERYVSSAYRYFDQEWRKTSEKYRPTARYFVPWVTLMPGETARFRIKLEVNRPSDELKVKISGSEAKALSVSPVTINAGQTGDYYDASELEVTCKSAFSNELAVEVYAKDELVGKMIFVPNRNIRSVDVAIVTVTTKKGDNGRRKPDEALLRGVERLLQQAYIVPNFRFYELDLSKPAEGTIETVSNSITRTSTPVKILEIEKFGGNKSAKKLSVSITNTESLFDILWKNEGKIGTERPIAKLRFINLHNFLNQMLLYTHKAESHQLNECYKMYFINEPIFTANDVDGVSNETHKTSCIAATGYTETTITHELLHCLSLNHPFEEEWAYFFKKQTTDNIMDYNTSESDTEGRKSLWYWQLKKLWNHLK